MIACAKRPVNCFRFANGVLLAGLGDGVNDYGPGGAGGGGVVQKWLVTESSSSDLDVFPEK